MTLAGYSQTSPASQNNQNTPNSQVPSPAHPTGSPSDPINPIGPIGPIGPDDDKESHIKDYRDADGDGYGNPNEYVKIPPISLFTFPPPASGYVRNKDDYDDTNDLITNIAPSNFYKDSDSDTFGNPEISIYSSVSPSGYVNNNSDCDDTNAAIHPNTVWYLDFDKDSWGSQKNLTVTALDFSLYDYPIPAVFSSQNPGQIPRDILISQTTFIGCKPPAPYNYALRDGDCENLDFRKHPKKWYRDIDKDTYGSDTDTKISCTQPSGYAARGGDCDDNNPEIIPQYWYPDTDGDGWGVFIFVANNEVVDFPNKLQCDQPEGYVANFDDKCPDEYGDRQGCLFIKYQTPTLSNENYVFTQVYQEAMTTPAAIQYAKDVIENVTYYDKLGRPKQQRAIQASKNAKDIVTHIEYDKEGRQDKQYLPFEASNIIGSYKTVNITKDINTYYKTVYKDDFTGVNVADINAYSKSEFETSSLNRVLEQGAPGTAWKVNPENDTDHTVKFDWQTNTANEVAYFYVDFTENSTEKPELHKGTTSYLENELYVTITKNENWKPTNGNLNTVREYTDRLGRMILKRTFASTSSATGAPSVVEAHDTYYVYDDFGNLTYVIPPKVTTTDGISDTELAELCYQYKYDYRNRLIEKKIPGKGLESIIYNKLDQPILTQDANLKADNTWLLTKYDVFGRVAYTGKISITGKNRKQLQTEANAYTDKLWVTRGAKVSIGGVDMYYTDDGYPKALASEVLTITYYDDYGFLGATPQQAFTKPNTIYSEVVSDQTKALTTGSLVKILDTSYWTTTVMYYDKKARPIYVASKNEYLNTTDIIESKLDFVGKVKETKTSHTKNSNAAIVTIDTFTYDHMGRVLHQTQKINSQDRERITSNDYDTLGQLIKKNVGGVITGTITPSKVEGLQEVNYKYNIRGWLTKINDPNTALGNKLFAFGINYNTPQHGATALFNGNIAETKWKTANDNVERYYKYEYDALNRITKADCSDSAFSLLGVSYDKMGNILSLSRHGWQGGTTYDYMDVLGYTYDSGNKLQKVTDIGNKGYGFKDGTNTNEDFDYDQNGNMIKDQNKGITGITYNHLNLPKTVTINNASHNGNITYIYDATGVKLKKITTEGSSLTTEYAGNYIYKNGNLEFFNHPEGYVEKEADGYKYVYQFKDHLGNIRLSYKDADKNGSISQSEIIEEKNYYPFGMTHSGYNSILRGRNHNYGFGGKEEQSELSLEWLDFSARNYDSALGRWMNIDPLAEAYYEWSPYNYSYNSPLKFTDPTGMGPEDWVDKNGNLVYDPSLNDGKGGFTEHATNTDKNIARSLRQTEEGEAQFQELVTSEAQIQVELDSDSPIKTDKKTGNVIAGETNNSEVEQDLKTGDVKVLKSKIVLFEKTIDAVVDATENQTVEVGGESINGLNFSEVLGSVFGHEIEHTTNENEKTARTNGNTETKPVQIQVKIIQQLKKNKKN
ncbi:RHS repeat-associated protein [Aquimarina sp. MAR_2010_214]|nr:RHS repeat-associated protein [Aquimarina sp. MAR_2010_214]